MNQRLPLIQELKNYSEVINMAEMKDSGVAWINTIPKEWKLKKIKYALKNRNENNNPIRSKNILSLTAKQGVIQHISQHIQMILL